MRVFIVAPTPMMQAGLRALLDSPEVQVIGTSSVADAFVEDMSEIDVIVAADEEQIGDVVRALGNVRTIALVALTQNDGETLPLLRPLELRGWAIVPADATAAQLQAAVSAAAQGLIVLPARLGRRLEESTERQAVATSGLLEVSDESLTPREREVLELVSQGLSNKLIARRLNISEHTVKFHISSLSSKLGASSRTDAVRRGLRRGLITL